MSLLGDLGTAIKNKLGGTSVDNTVPIYNGTTCTLQGSSVTISDTNVVTASGGFVGSLTGNASTATKLQTARTINGVSFDGTNNISVNTNNSEIIKFDSGTTEGTDLYTFNGSSTKTIDIKAGTNITLTKTAGAITINANDTSINLSEVQGLGTGVSTFLATPNSTNLAAALTDETGSGSLVFATSPTLVTPNIGVATGTSFNSITGLSSIDPLIAGTATIGTSTAVARADHIHPVQTSVTGNAGTATKLQTARTINGVSFDGTNNIVINPCYFNSGVGTSGITVATNYSLFPTANDTITLSVGTYRVSIMASVTVATSTTSGTLLLNPRGAGTAVGTIQGITNSTITNGGTSNQFFLSSTALGTAFTVSAASAVAGRVYTVYGEYIVNVTTAGTFIPAYQFSATLTSGVVTLNAGNSIIIDNITDTSVTTFGGWN